MDTSEYKEGNDLQLEEKYCDTIFNQEHQNQQRHQQHNSIWGLLSVMAPMLSQWTGWNAHTEETNWTLVCVCKTFYSNGKLKKWVSSSQ